MLGKNRRLNGGTGFGPGVFGVAFLPTLGPPRDRRRRRNPGGSGPGRRAFVQCRTPARRGDVRVRVFLMPEPDREVLCYSRRVLGYALWLVYQFDDAEVVALAVTDRPPRPAD